MQNFSVLLSVYHKERPEFLCASLDSVFNQTVCPNEVVLVEDGPLTEDLYRAIAVYTKAHQELKIVPLEKNVGLGPALNEGLKHCTNELVARMDTDDINYLDRFEKQLRFMEEHPEVDVLGAWIDEFIGEPVNVVSTRKTPEKHADIYEYGKTKNPTNHAVVMYRKQAVMSVNSYQPFDLFEDYYLWSRMLVKGKHFHNLQEPLLYVRISADMFKRRGGWKYAMTEASFQREIHRIGYISFLKSMKNIGIRFSIRIMPNSLRGFIYKKLIRK